MIIEKLELEYSSINKIALSLADSYNVDDFFSRDINERFWLEDTDALKDHLSYEAYFSPSKKQYVSGTSLSYDISGIRPVMHVSSNDDDIMQYGHNFILGHSIFSYIRRDLVASENVIGYSPFLNKNTTYTRVEETDAYNFLDEWRKWVKQHPVRKIKSTKTIEVDSVGVTTRIPDSSDIMYLAAARVTGFPYWLNARTDSYTGMIVGPDGQLHEQELSRHICHEADIPKEFGYINVNPIISFKTINTFSGENIYGLNKGDYFDLNGRLCYIYNIDSDGYVEAFCLNSIGVSCFSNAIADKTGDKREELEFYKSSEIHGLLECWTKKNIN